ncbi:MAG: DUF1150 family protein [Pseudomonadota bacterium]
MDNKNENVTPPAAAPLLPGQMVYVKAVDSSQVQGLQGVPPGITLYAIHSEAGAPLAVVGNREAAFHAARQHNMRPVSVH